MSGDGEVKVDMVGWHELVCFSFISKQKLFSTGTNGGKGGLVTRVVAAATCTPKPWEINPAVSRPYSSYRNSIYQGLCSV